MPKVLFLDEPTIGLDIDSKRNIREFLKKLQKEYGITLLLTSHDMDDVEQVCERVIVINHGKIILDDSLDILQKHYSQDRFLRIIFEEQKAVDLKEYGEVVEQEDGNVLIKVPQKEMIKTISTISRKFKLDDLHIESIPLENIISDIFHGDFQSD